MTVKDYYNNAVFNSGKGYNNSYRYMGLSALKLHKKAISLGAKDTDKWSIWESKVTPDLTELRTKIYEEAMKEREEQLIKLKIK